MSRAPDEADAEAAPDYLDAFEQVFRLHEQGRSFSGKERNSAFLNIGGGHFADISAASGVDFPDDGRGLAVVDWDHDGDLDLWFANRTAPQLRFLRNDLSNDNTFLELRLTGTRSNRDAIGARAELRLRLREGGTALLVRTVRAGEGFLSQSSKWLHFGLGSGATIEDLEVRWPNGDIERFVDLEPGRFYRILEGDGRAQRWRPPAGRKTLTAGNTQLPEPTTPPRVLFAARVPMPLLRYRDFQGASRSLPETGTPVLLNLWATWCVPCHAELEELTKRQEALRSSGLEIVALSVDGLDEAAGTDAKDAERFLERLDFPHRAGMADELLLTKLQVLHDRLFSTHLELTVPTSFLIDSEGRWAVLYRGAVDLDRLLEDTRNLSAGPTQRRLLAAPFAGRWSTSPQQLRLTSIAQRFADEGLFDDATHYLRLELEQQSDDAELHASLAALLTTTGHPSEALSHYRKAISLDAGNPLFEGRIADLLAIEGRDEEALQHYSRALAAPSARLHHNLAGTFGRLGRVDEARTHYEAALRLDPVFPAAHSQLGTIALTRGELDAAERHFAALLESEPDNANALNNLGVALLHQGRAAEAEPLLRRAVELESAFAGAHNNLGIVLMRLGRDDEALARFERALALDPELSDARENLESLRRTLDE